MSKLYVYCLLGLAIAFLGCKGKGSAKSSLSELDLMQYGMPIKIKAPVGAEVQSNDLGVMKDVTVKGDGNFYLQVTSGIATTNNIAKIKAEQLLEVQKAMFFDSVIEENEDGFIYKKKISDTRTNHDFRYVKIQGDQEYVFQTGLSGQYSLEDVKKMMAAVQ